MMDWTALATGCAVAFMLVAVTVAMRSAQNHRATAALALITQAFVVAALALRPQHVHVIPAWLEISALCVVTVVAGAVYLDTTVPSSEPVV